MGLSMGGRQGETSEQTIKGKLQVESVSIGGHRRDDLK